MAIASPPAHTPMPELTVVLERLGLASYSSVLTDNGFHNFETVLDITEDDLTALHFKLGHRRALQREIATYRGLPSSLALEPDNGSTEQTGPSSASNLDSQTPQTPPPTQQPREKRRYRRHPRPDSNAPKKPRTAYVNFADELRTHPDISNLSFVSIAREVGRRWQELPAEKKRIWESHAARALQEYEAQMDEYKKTDQWRKYQLYLAEFKAQQAAATVSGKRTNSVRTLTRRESSRASPSASSDSPPSSSSITSTSTEAEVCHNALTLAFSELVSLRGEILGQGVHSYNEQNLPSEELVRRAMYAFVQGTGSLLYMWTYQQVDEILDRIYRPWRPVDALTLAECFIVAAMGAHYDLETFPDRIRKILYASGSLQFNEKSARLDYLRTMRLLLSMAFYALLEKHMSARYLIAAGLQIARWKCPALKNSKVEDPVSDIWRRIWRSLIFMDCWLSYTLGYGSEVTSSDIAVACIANRSEGASIDEEIHSQTSKVALIAAEIARVLASPEATTRENISMLTRKLEAWRADLPYLLQIPVLTSNSCPDITLYQRRAILMVHIMYLGALILLYRQFLIATAETQLTDGAAWNLNLPVEEAKRYRDDCAVAGQQIARILDLISFDGTLTKRCWLIIYWAFTASIVLLYSATTKLLEGRPETVQEDLAFSKSCMNMLETCRSCEPIAARYVDTLLPLYDTLRDVHHRMVGRAKTSIFSIIQADPNQLSPPIPLSKEEMGPVSEKLSELLTDPFGRKQSPRSDSSMRRMLNNDGSYAVFWWK